MSRSAVSGMHLNKYKKVRFSLFSLTFYFVMAVDARNKNTVDVIFCSPGSLFVMAVDSSNRK